MQGYFLELGTCRDSICSNMHGCNNNTDFVQLNACLAKSYCPTCAPETAYTGTPAPFCVTCGYTNKCEVQSSLAESNTCLTTNCTAKCANTFQDVFTSIAPTTTTTTTDSQQPLQGGSLVPRESFSFFPFTRI